MSDNNKIVGLDGSPVEPHKEPDYRTYRITTYGITDNTPESQDYRGFLGVTPDFVAIGDDKGAMRFVTPLCRIISVVEISVDPVLNEQSAEITVIDDQPQTSK